MKINEIGIELKELGLKDQSVYRNLTVGELVDDIVANSEGLIGLRGAAMVDTGIYTGRSPKDKYIVDEPSSNSDIWWGLGPTICHYLKMAHQQYIYLLVTVQCKCQYLPLQHLLTQSNLRYWLLYRLPIHPLLDFCKHSDP